MKDAENETNINNLRVLRASVVKKRGAGPDVFDKAIKPVLRSGDLKSAGRIDAQEVATWQI
jgi:hypothetical protein